MKEPKVYWILSDNKTIREISWEEWRRIYRHEMDRYERTRLLVRVHSSKLFFVKGKRSFWCPLEPLQKILGVPQQ